MDNVYQHWTIEVKEHIAFLTLNRPVEKNRLGRLTFSELKDISDQITNDTDIWVILLQAAGNIFSAGVDINLIGTMVGQASDDYQENLRSLQICLDQFEAIKKPIIAAVQGPVIGGGMILSLCCDFRIAADNVVFELPEVKRSIGVIMGTQRITRIIGVTPTKEMAMLGTKVGAEKALQLGLVSTVVPLEELQDHALNFAKQFLKLPPLAVGLNKQIIDEGLLLDRAGQDLEIEAQEKLLKTDDFKEAIDSFFEKRPPVYKGT